MIQKDLENLLRVGRGMSQASVFLIPAQVLYAMTGSEDSLKN